MALTISTGFVVDDAIVVLENISRYLEEGVPRVEAAIRGAAEVGFTVVSITLSLIAVFAPLLFFGGIVGRLFTEFSLTLTVAVLISMVVSLTTTPMMCALILPRGPGRTRARSIERRSASSTRCSPSIDRHCASRFVIPEPSRCRCSPRSGSTTTCSAIR